VRSGYTLVLAAWAAFVAAGASYAKLAEHFGPALAGRAGAGLASAAYDAVVVLALAAAVAVLAGAVLARRAFARFLRRGGWALIRRRVAAAAAATVLAAGALAGLAGWAHSLTAAQRNGQSAGYSAAFVAVAAAAALALGLWASAGVTVGRHLDLRPRLLTAETVLARAAAALMTLITVAVAVWWAVVATAAPWYLWGSPAGTASSPFDPNLVGTMLVMLAATTLALYGARQAARSRRDLRRLSTGH
jgi:hypothetical protein